jgi:hypothetical protein
MPESSSPSRPAREVEIRLPDGRRVRARIAPPLARRTDVARLQRSQEKLQQRVTELESRADAAAADLLKNISDLKQRARELAPAQIVRQQIENAKQAALQTQMRGVTSVVNTLQATAYGDKGTLLSKNNLLLAGGQLFWTLLDPFLQATGLVTPQTATILAAIAPIGTLATGEVLVGDRQHVRFVSGVTEVTIPQLVGQARESLRPKIADGFWDEFRGRQPSVTAALVGSEGALTHVVSAKVNAGTLEILVVRSRVADLRGRLQPETVKVGWTVDTGEDVG